MACKLFESYAQAQREATVLRAFEHPGIVRCFGTGRAGYMLMEFLEGPTLSQYLRSKPGGHLSVPDALRVAIYLGSALMHMHARGFLHLDVKPSNVITRRGARPRLPVRAGRPELPANAANVVWPLGRTAIYADRSIDRGMPVANNGNRWLVLGQLLQTDR